MKQRVLLALFCLVLLVLLGELGYYFHLTRTKKQRIVPSGSQQLASFQNQEPIELVNQHPEYLMEINPLFSKEEIGNLVGEYGKEKITFYLVGSEDEVPWDGATQRGREFDGEANLPMNMMMAIYKGNKVDYYFYPYLENYQRYGERKLGVLSGVISYKILQALAAKDRGYLAGPTPAPQIPMEKIKRYSMENPLIVVKQR